MRMKRLGLSVSLIVFLPLSAFAQETLSTILPTVFLDGVRMTSTVAAAGNPHEAHFIAALGRTPAGAFDFNKLIVGQLGTFPIGTSSGGFVFNFDPASGAFAPASQSFGSGFAERALTNGKGRFGFGMNFQHLTFESYEGNNLEDGSLQFVLQHNDCCPVVGSFPDPFFEGDLVIMKMSLKVKTDIVAPFFSYGVNNRWDVGLVVPIVKVVLSPTITSTIDRIATGPTSLIHSWDGTSNPTKVSSISGSASGIGDILFRSKYRLVDGGGGGLAVGLDLRLPTGDKEELLGTGGVQTKLMAIASGEIGRVAPHLNLGYTYSTGELSSELTSLPETTDPTNPPTQAQIDLAHATESLGGSLRLPNEFNYVFGVDIAAHSSLTISGDIIGRTVLDTERSSVVSRTYQYRTANGAPLQTTARDTLETTGTGNLNLLLGVIGAKWNIPGTSLLLTGSVLFPLNDAGLRPNVTPVVGVDYSFGK